MTAAVLEPPSTAEQLRARAELLADEVLGQLSPGGDGDPRAARLARRAAFFEQVRAAVKSLAASPAWRAHDLTTELLLLVEDLRDAIDADPDATDAGWAVREVLQRMLAVLRAMVRQLLHNDMDQPELAAPFVADALADVPVAAVAELLGTSARMVGNYRKGAVGQVRKNPARVTLVGQLVAELAGSMTPRGVLLWFDARAAQLGDRTPRALLDEDPATHRPALIALARGGRAQTDRGGVVLGALDQAA